MTICAVINLETNQLVNTIVANESDLAPEGCKLVEIPNGYFWDESTGQLTMNVELSPMLIGVDNGN
jgi:hypothetical protein